MPGNDTSTTPTIDELRQSLYRFSEGKQRMCVPVQESDDDRILDRAIDELATLRAAVARLAAVEEAAIHLAAQFPDQGAATPHASLGEYGASMLYALRAALRGTEGDDAR